MDHTYQRSYRGPLLGAIFDWAGTTVDFGCLAPAAAFSELFRRHGVAASMAEARGPMGMHKRDHIATMLAMPRLAEAWTQAHGAAPTEHDVEALFQEFIPLQLEILPQYSHLIPGVAEAVQALRARNMKIGATTGYNEEMMAIGAAAAKAAGYAPDVSVAVTQVPAGRPAPWMALQAAMHLNLYPLEAVVKIGDTVSDVEEGLNGGMWTIAVVEHGNEVGLSEADLKALAPQARETLFAIARERLAKAGAHYVAATIDEVPAIVEQINARLARGERP